MTLSRTTWIASAVTAAVLLVGGAVTVHHWLPAGCHGVTLPAEVASPPGLVTIRAATTCRTVRWHVVDPGLTQVPPELASSPKVGVFLALRDGRYRVLAYTAHADEASAIAETVVIVGNAPVPPGPTPPVPPVPPVPPSPPPIPGDGLRVLIVYETADIGALPRAQAAILASGTVRDWLNAHCVKGPDGKTAEWRVWDKDVDTASESDGWKAAMGRKRDRLPWLIVSNPKGQSYEGPLPATVAEMMALLQKAGG